MEGERKEDYKIPSIDCQILLSKFNIRHKQNRDLQRHMTEVQTKLQQKIKKSMIDKKMFLKLKDPLEVAFDRYRQSLH